MSFASCSFQCGYLPDGSSLTMSLLGNTGDLFQYFSGTGPNPTDITPDWSGLTGSDRPLIRIVLMESDPDITQATIVGYMIPSLTRWFLDGVEILFNASGVSINGGASGGAENVAGLFRRVDPYDSGNPDTRSDAPYGGLEICGNLVSALGGLSANISCQTGLDVNGTAMSYQANTTIRMIRSVGESKYASIYCDAGDSFVLDEKDNQSVVCKVRCFQNGSEVTATFYRIWYLLENGLWVQKATTDTLTVDRDDISTFGEVKVECYSDAARTQLIASDIQTIQDSSDALIVAPNPTPADGKFYQTGGPDKITFAPKLQNSDGSTGPACKFIFSVFDHAGVPQGGTPTPKQDTYDLPKSIAIGINEGPVVIIQAVEP